MAKDFKFLIFFVPTVLINTFNDASPSVFAPKSFPFLLLYKQFIAPICLTRLSNDFSRDFKTFSL